MTDEEIKKIIQEEADSKYNGGFRHLRPKYLKTLIGVRSFDRIYEKISKDLHEPYSLATFCFMNDILENPTCTCGNKTRFNTTTKKFLQYCSNKCKWDNNDKIQEVKRATNLDKYGHINVLGSDYGRDKLEKTNLEKYGYTNHTKGKQYKEKVKGRKASPESIEKTSNAHKRKFYDTFPTRFPTISAMFPFEEYKGVRDVNDKYPWKCLECSTEFLHTLNNNRSPICPKCKPKGTKYEVMFKEYFMKWGIPFTYRNKQLLSNNTELDIYIEKYKIAIETCGLYWHSSASSYTTEDRHFIKNRECVNKGIKLFTIFDDELNDLTKRKIVISTIKKSVFAVKRNINGKKCDFVTVDLHTTCKFHSKYNINGYKYADYNFGLVLKNRLVAVLSFIATEDGGMIISNYSTILNFNVISGFNQLFRIILEEYGPKYVIFEVDKRWPHSKDLKRNSFKLVKELSPRDTFTSNFLDRYDYQHIANNGMQDENWHSIHDCGYEIWMYTAHENGYQFEFHPDFDERNKFPHNIDSSLIPHS